MDTQNIRNMLLAGVLAMAILLGWQKVMEHYYPGMNKAPVPAASAPANGTAPAPQAAATGKPTREGGLTDDADKALEAKDLTTALNPATRVPIAAPGLSGSINLVGGVIDDLSTNRHTASVEKGAGAQRVFSPAGTPGAAICAVRVGQRQWPARPQSSG